MSWTNEIECAREDEIAFESHARGGSRQGQPNMVLLELETHMSAVRA